MAIRIRITDRGIIQENFAGGPEASNFTVNVPTTVNVPIQATTGFSGSLTSLSDGTPYLIAGPGISISTGSNGAVTITNDGTVGDITGVTAGTGLSGGGTSGTVTLNINDSVVATVSGTTFTGVTKHNVGLSGSLTKLTDGTSYLIAGLNMTLTSGSNGSVTFASSQDTSVNSVGASQMDLANGARYFTKTASGALSWTFANVPATGAVVIVLELTNGGTGTQTWPAAVKWPGGTAPTLTTSGIDVLAFLTDDGGTIWRGVALMTDSK